MVLQHVERLHAQLAVGGGREIVAVGIDIAGRMDRVRFVHRVPVEPQLLVHQLDVVARNPDGALDVVFFDIQRIAKHDNVAAPHVPVGQNQARCRPGRSVGQLIHQHVVANQQRAHHGSAGDDKSLHQAGGGEQQQDDGDGPFRDESAVHLPRHLLIADPQAAHSACFDSLHSSHCNGLRVGHA